MRTRKANREIKYLNLKYQGKATIKKAEEYLDSCVDTIEVETYEGVVLTKARIKQVVKLPTKEGLALVLGVRRRQITEWKDKHPEFGVVYDRLLAMQGERLIQKSLGGDYDPRIAKMMLSNHGYVEKSTIEHEGAIESNYSDEQIDAIAERVRSSRRIKS